MCVPNKDNKCIKLANFYAFNINRFYNCINIDYQVDMLQTALNHNMKQSQKLPYSQAGFLVLKVLLVLCEHANIKSNTLENYFTTSFGLYIVLYTAFTRCEYYERKVQGSMIKYFAKTLCATIHIFVITFNGMKFIHIRE